MKLLDKKFWLLDAPVFRQDEPRHIMVLEHVDEHVVAIVSGQQVANTAPSKPTVIKLKEVGYTIYDPVFYFPRNVVNMSILQESKKPKTKCPLKGYATYFHVIAGKKLHENAAWSYQEIFSFDQRLVELKDRIAFDSRIKTLFFKQ